MEREKIQSMLIDFIDGKLNETEMHQVEQELIKDADLYREYEQLKEVLHTMDHSQKLEPGSELKLSFEKFLQEEIKQSKKTRIVFFQPAFYRVAAAVTILLVAGTIGYLVNEQQKREAELATLREEMRQTRELILYKLDNELSASQRMQGVNVALSVDKADDTIVNALVKTMNEDPNTNVRLAAFEALSKFHEEPKVKKALIKSLSTQNDPVVQIALIQLLVRMKEKAVIKDLQKIVDDEKSINAVKDEAHSGILRLS
jgi:hypothetical protein